LAYPTGIALNQEENVLFVCETCKNRVIRFVGTPDGDFF
jgi:sugar lactone lactonase YvrE